MCTVILLRRPGHDWPVVLGANRDERLDRTWDPPAAYWPAHPGLVGGRDRMGGGTWMAARSGIVATVLNRPGSLGPAPGKRSRGELPLLALQEDSAAAAAAAIGALDGGAWRPFNMVIADAREAFFLRGLGEGRPEAVPVEEGVTMVTAHEPNDPTSPRIARHLPRFRAAPAPDPARGDWAAWEALLADDGFGEEGLGGALNVPPVRGFGTVCSSLLAIGAGGDLGWHFSPGRPAPGRFALLDLETRS
jgi:hypothetical protein